jgi:hypothetical protein
MRNVSDKSCRENKNKFYAQEIFPEILTFYEIMWQRTLEPEAKKGNIVRRMRLACWITKTTGTHSKYIIAIAVPGNNGYANAPQC